MNRTLAITISPPPRAESPQYLYDCDIGTIRRWLNKFSHHYLLYPEFTIDSRLHYHGVVHVDDFTKFHKTKNTFSKKFGFVKVKPIGTTAKYCIKAHLGWLAYCKKQYGECFLKAFYYKKLRRGKKLTLAEKDTIQKELDSGCKNILSMFKIREEIWDL